MPGKKEHTVVMEFELPADLPKHYVDALYYMISLFMEDFQKHIDGILKVAGYEGRTYTAPVNFGRDN